MAGSARLLRSYGLFYSRRPPRTCSGGTRPEPGSGRVRSGRVGRAVSLGSARGGGGRAIMAWFPSTELGLALGIRQTAIPIGGAVGAAVLPVLGSAGGTRLAFIFLGAACLVGAVVAAAFVRGGTVAEPEIGDVTQ